MVKRAPTAASKRQEIDCEQHDYNKRITARRLVHVAEPYPDDLYYFAILNSKNDGLYVGYKRLAAVAGHRQAQYDMGIIYECGDRGVKVNAEESIRFYEMAHKQGCLASTGKLARIYCHGFRKTSDYMNNRKGMDYLHLLADKYNVCWAQYALGKHYTQGDINRKEISDHTSLGIIYLEKACKQGDKNAADELKKLGVLAPPRQLVKLDGRAGEDNELYPLAPERTLDGTETLSEGTVNV